MSGLSIFFWDYFAALTAYTCSALDMLEDQICRIIIGIIWKQSKPHKSISLSGQYLYQTAFSSNIALNIHSLMHTLPLLFFILFIYLFFILSSSPCSIPQDAPATWSCFYLVSVGIMGNDIFYLIVHEHFTWRMVGRKQKSRGLFGPRLQSTVKMGNKPFKTERYRIH